MPRVAAHDLNITTSGRGIKIVNFLLLNHINSGSSEQSEKEKSQHKERSAHRPRHRSKHTKLAQLVNCFWMKPYYRKMPPNPFLKELQTDAMEPTHLEGPPLDPFRGEPYEENHGAEARKTLNRRAEARKKLNHGYPSEQSGGGV